MRDDTNLKQLLATITRKENYFLGKVNEVTNSEVGHLHGTPQDGTHKHTHTRLIMLYLIKMLHFNRNQRCTCDLQTHY